MPIVANVVTQMLTVPTVVFVAGAAIAIVAIVFCTICGVVGRVAGERQREQSRREIAAYVAEGSIEPDKAIELMKASPPIPEE